MSKKTSTGTPETQSQIITLCGVQGCCPTVDFSNPEEVVLRDDHDGMVRLTRGQWDDLKRHIVTK